MKIISFAVLLLSIQAPLGALAAPFTFKCVDYTCEFVLFGDNPTVGTVWDFGDGNTDDTGATKVVHEYEVPGGTFSVTLTVGDEENPIPKAVTVPDPMPPTADFKFECTGLKCSFTDMSKDPDGMIDTWHWNFGDDETSDQQNPTHDYDKPGKYEVTLEVADKEGALDDATKTILVDIAQFEFKCDGLTCIFENESKVVEGVNITKWSWDFGDGTIAKAQEPQDFEKPYNIAGKYIVELKVSDDEKNTSTIRKTVEVSPCPLEDGKIEMYFAGVFWCKTTCQKEGMQYLGWKKGRCPKDKIPPVSNPTPLP